MNENYGPIFITYFLQKFSQLDKVALAFS